MAAPEDHSPGRDWLAIVSRPTLAEFASAFADAPTLEASVLRESMSGAPALRAFFEATRAMYDVITFTAEHRVAHGTCLEWQGEYRGRPVSGVTFLITGSGDAISRVRIFHMPLDQLTAFAVDLQRRLDAAKQGDFQ